jgi:hypothetical protein
MNCKCNINQKCMHPKHAKYSLPIIESDCEGCPMKIVGLPSALKQVRNFLNDAVAVGVSGFARVTERARDERLGICGQCPLHEDGRCLACGCSSRVKSEFSSEACPLGYWGHVDPNMKDTDVAPVPEFSPRDLIQIYANSETVAHRNSVCEGCRFRSGRRCTKCSCNIFHITMIESSKCPESKW